MFQPVHVDLVRSQAPALTDFVQLGTRSAKADALVAAVGDPLPLGRPELEKFRQVPPVRFLRPKDCWGNSGQVVGFTASAFADRGIF